MMGPRSVLRIGVATAKSSLVLGETEDLCRPVVFLAKGFVYENSSTGGLGVFCDLDLEPIRTG